MRSSLKYQGGFVLTLALPWLAPLLTSVITWIFRKSVVSFLIVTGIYVLIEFLTPVVIRLAGSYFNTSIPDLINNFSPATWWFLSAFKIDYALKVVFAAYATRFLIRRIPFIG